MRSGTTVPARQPQDPREVAPHVDLQLVAVRRQDDLRNQRADDLRRLQALVLSILPQGQLQVLDLRAVPAGYLGVEQGRRLLGDG